jgi:hypothetical protein
MINPLVKECKAKLLLDLAYTLNLLETLNPKWVGHRDRVAEPQKMLSTGIFFQKPPVPGFSGGG